MIEIRANSVIERPASLVFEFVADMENNPRWQKGMDSCTWTSEGPIAVGSTYDQQASFLGKEIRTSFEVTEFVAGERIRIESRSGPLQLNIVRTVEALDSQGCTVRAVIMGDSSGLFRIADPIMKILVNRSVQADYKRLKEVLEVEA